METSLPLRSPGQSTSNSHNISCTHTFPYRLPNYLLVCLSSTNKRRQTVSSLQHFSSMKVLIRNFSISYVRYSVSRSITINCFSSATCSGGCWSGLSCHPSLHCCGNRGQRSEGGPRNSDKGLFKLMDFLFTLIQ